MYESDEDYIKLLKDPKRYMNEELEFIETKYEENMKKYFPVARCGDIKLYFNHYDSFEEAKLCWERRKQRIDWDNLFVMMCTEKRDIADEFAKLSYKKKICFVPFDVKDNSLKYINLADKENKKISAIVLGMAIGYYPYYDIFDLIEKVKISPVTDSY